MGKGCETTGARVDRGSTARPSEGESDTVVMVCGILQG